MSTSDQLLTARMAGVCRRHCARGEVDDLDAAVAELLALAGDRPDLLAEHAGVSLAGRKWSHRLRRAVSRQRLSCAELQAHRPTL